MSIRGVAARFPDVADVQAAGIGRAVDPAVPEIWGKGLQIFHGKHIGRGQKGGDFGQSLGRPLALFGGEVGSALVQRGKVHVQHEAVRPQPFGAFHGLPHFGDQRPRVSRRVEIGVGGQVHVQTGAFAVDDPGDFFQLPGRGEVFAMLARLQRQQGHVFTALRRKAHGRNILCGQQKRCAAEFQARNRPFFQ